MGNANSGSIKRGEVRNPNGRPKGSRNKTTEEIRALYQQLVEDKLPEMSGWLNQVAEKDPEKALELALKLSEYFIPKLQRTEVTGADGGDLFKDIKFNFGK